MHMDMAFHSLYSHQRQSGHLDLRLSFHRGEAEGKEGEVRSKSCQLSRVKNGVDIFITKGLCQVLRKQNKTKTSPVSEGSLGSELPDRSNSDHCPGIGFG